MSHIELFTSRDSVHLLNIVQALHRGSPVVLYVTLSRDLGAVRCAQWRRLHNQNLIIFIVQILVGWRSDR